MAAWKEQGVREATRVGKLFANDKLVFFLNYWRHWLTEADTEKTNSEKNLQRS